MRLGQNLGQWCLPPTRTPHPTLTAPGAAGIRSARCQQMVPMAHQRQTRQENHSLTSQADLTERDRMLMRR